MYDWPSWTCLKHSTYLILKDLLWKCISNITYLAFFAVHLLWRCRLVVLMWRVLQQMSNTTFSTHRENYWHWAVSRYLNGGCEIRGLESLLVAQIFGALSNVHALVLINAQSTVLKGNVICTQGCIQVSDFKGEIPLNISEKGGSVHWKRGIKYKWYIIFVKYGVISVPTLPKIWGASC